MAVQVFRLGHDGLISVTDRGVGVGEEDLPHLFEKHYRATTARMTEGVGLGLFGSRLIAGHALPHLGTERCWRWQHLYGLDSAERAISEHGRTLELNIFDLQEYNYIDI